MAFPAGWNNSTPWYMTGGQPNFGTANNSGGNGNGQQPNAPAAVKPTMPPPAFPAQPWQGSRLGPLPPIYSMPSDAPGATNEVRICLTSAWPESLFAYRGGFLGKFSHACMICKGS